MLRPYERSFNSGQMLRKLSPLNSTFDKSHYSLLSRAHIEAVSTFPTSTPLPPPLFLFFFFLLTPSFPSLFFVLPFHQHAAVNFNESSLDEWQYQGRTHTTPNQIKIRSKFTNWRFNIQEGEWRGLTWKILRALSPCSKLAKAIVYFKRGTFRRDEPMEIYRNM